MGLTPDQLRNAFIHSGYAVDQPLIWSWLSPPLTSFHAYDQRLGRMLLVQVYPDQAPTVLLPRLVPGYGPPVWFQNVALAEASNVELARLTDCLQAGG
jgi:hypothetical protein